MRVRLGRLWIGATFLALGMGCGGKQDSQAYDPLAPPRDPLDCIVPLPATDYDGTPWPSYSEKLAEFEKCDASGLYATQASCSDGKQTLGFTGAFEHATYYYQGETLVGFWGWSDSILVNQDGCDSNRPEGTLAGVTCDAVASRAIDCGVSIVCEIGTAQCDGRLLQLCAADGSEWATLQLCASAAFCEVDPTPRCLAPACAVGQTRCNGAYRAQCNSDQTSFELIETCASADRCTPDVCL